nr:hypothetical protein [Tanacetum cinerariifolium]
KAKSSYDPLEVERTEAEQLKIVLRRSRQGRHISQRGGSSTDEGTDDDDDDNDDEEEIAKIDELEDTESGGGDAEEIESDEETSHPPIPPTPIPSEVLQNLPTFDSVFRFNERLKSLEASFFEYRQTNPFAEAISNIPGIVHQYMNLQMHEAVRVAVQIQADRLHDSYQRENDEFLKTTDDNMKRIIKEQRRREDDDDQEGPSARSDRGSKRQREGGEPELASTPSEPATRSASRSITGTQSRQMSASKSAFVEEPV